MARRNNKGGRWGKPQAFRRVPKGLLANSVLELKCEHGTRIGDGCEACLAVYENDFAHVLDARHEQRERQYDRALLVIMYLVVPVVAAGVLGAYLWRVLP